MNDARKPDIHDMITQLTSTHSQREPYNLETGRWVPDPDTHLERFLVRSSWPTHHGVDAPALVHQLLGATPAGSGEMSGAAPTSRPAARIESIDTLMLIDDAAARWIRRLGEDDPGDLLDQRTGRPIPGSGTIRCLRKLHGLHPATKHCGQHHGKKTELTGQWCCQRHDLEHDIRDWWHQARIITGWDSPAYRPFNTCPVCEHLGGLRVNASTQSALCIECRSVWDEAQIGLLAEHIRAENGEADGAA
ncbi:hypothetical protein [Nocardioides sp.]|uniref:hypothetical protein n=1 Tax=Nocardioides sp. TaxID=35761 RepID=UPI0035659D14